jgi:hypothetical protein
LNPTPLINRQRLSLLVLLFVLLSSVYLITYSGRIESGDTGRFVDAVSSFVDYGDFSLDQWSWQFPPQFFDKALQYPLTNAAVEPLQVFLAAPLYALAKIIPGVGLVHAIYLLNVVVCALAGCVLFLYALALGYQERTAALAALAFGVGTAIFPYSKTFFREPLALLLLLTCGLLVERLRGGGYRSLLLMLGVAVAVGALLLTKASALLALPALLVLALPDLRNTRLRRALITLVLVAVLVVVLFVVLSALSVFGERYNLLRQLSERTPEYLGTALQAYLLSIGGSVWGTSPVVLLALPGMALLLRQRRWRTPLAVVLMVAAFAVGYAWLNGPHWFGGLSWPPRFLIPVLPFLIIAALPAFARMEKQPVWALVGAALLLYSVWVQLSGVTLDWGVFPSHLPPEANGLIEWGGGLNDPRYLRWVLVPTYWQSIPMDIAWTISGAAGMMIAFGALAAAAGIWLARALRCGTSRRVLILPVVLIVMVFVGLRLLYADDPRTLSHDDSLYAIEPILEAETEPGDVVLLSSPRYVSFFMNAAKPNGAARLVTLPLQPGEQSSPAQEPQVRSDNPNILLTKETIQLIYNLTATRDRLWLLVDGSPDLPWSVRPVERFMSAHYYPIRTFQTGGFTRLIEYSTARAPDMFAYRSADHLTDLAFGEQIRLVGFDLPGGMEYAAGDALAISTYWVTDAPLAGNYTIGLYLRAADGSPVAQVDAQPGGGFYPTSGWQVGLPVWDNRAIRLPDDLATGTYQLWVKVYDFGADMTARDLPISAGEKVDDSIGVLPVTITVR